MILRIPDKRVAFERKLVPEIHAYLNRVLIDPLRGIVPLTRNNASFALRNALAEGSITYRDGAFRGRFNSHISQELRSYGARMRAGSFELSMLPVSLRDAVSQANSHLDEVHQDVLTAISDIKPPKPEYRKDDTGEIIAAYLLLMGDAADTQVASAASMAEYRDATNDYLEAASQGTVEKRAESLSRLVESNFASGGSLYNLQQIIDIEARMSLRRATMIAENAVGRLVSAVTQEASEDLGSNSYMWQTCEDHKVRHWHRTLNKQEFRWDDPPVVDPATGRRCHPGEDYNCRCIALPIIP